MVFYFHFSKSIWIRVGKLLYDRGRTARQHISFHIVNLSPIKHLLDEQLANSHMEWQYIYKLYIDPQKR